LEFLARGHVARSVIGVFGHCGCLRRGSVGNDFAHSLRRSRAAATGCDGAPPHLRRRGGADSDGQTEPARAGTHRECALGPVPATMTQSAERAATAEANSFLLTRR